MYKLINTTTGESFNVETPRYIRRNHNGTWIFCSEDDAEGISIDGEINSILDKPPIENTPTVLIKKVDGGIQIQNVLRENLQQAHSVEEVKAAILDIYDALFDLYGLQ